MPVLEPRVRGDAPAPLVVRGRRFTWGERTFIMGIVNVSADSFSGDGRPGPGEAAEHAAALYADGADVIDVGAESTRPGHTPIDAEEEMRRLLPAVRAIRARLPEVPISVDTFKAEIFAAAHSAGGDILNSIWGIDDRLLDVLAHTGAPVVIMHNKRVAVYERGVADEVISTLAGAAQRARGAGVSRERIILDPGIGFAKDAEANLELLAELGSLVALGFPTLIGTSRKSTIGRLTGRAVGERGFGTAATVALAIAAGIDIVRVHDVAQMRDVVQVTDAIVRGWRPADWSV